MMDGSRTLYRLVIYSFTYLSEIIVITTIVHTYLFLLLVVLYLTLHNLTCEMEAVRRCRCLRSTAHMNGMVHASRSAPSNHRCP